METAKVAFGSQHLCPVCNRVFEDSRHHKCQEDTRIITIPLELPLITPLWRKLKSWDVF